MNHPQDKNNWMITSNNKQKKSPRREYTEKAVNCNGMKLHRALWALITTFYNIEIFPLEEELDCSRQIIFTFIKAFFSVAFFLFSHSRLPPNVIEKEFEALRKYTKFTFNVDLLIALIFIFFVYVFVFFATRVNKLAQISNDQTTHLTMQQLNAVQSRTFGVHNVLWKWKPAD